MSFKSTTCRILLVGLLVLLALGQASEVSAGNNVWTSHGPWGGKIYALAIDPLHPDTLYAGTMGGSAFKTTDGGGSWTAVNTGLTGHNTGPIGVLAISPSNPDKLYAGTDAGVFKTINGGGNWTAFSTGLTNNDTRLLQLNR